MLAGADSDALIHFETRANKPKVFRMTTTLIAEAKARNQAKVATSFGEDLADMSWLATATGLVASNDILRDPQFPLLTLADAAPRLRWIHIIGAGIEPLLPLTWLPPHIALTNNSGVHAEKMRESATMMLLMLHARVPVIISNQRQAKWDQIFMPTIRDRVVLIIGVGDMGGAVAAAAQDLGLFVLGVRRSGTPHPQVNRMHRPDQLDAILPEADFVVLATPLTRDTTALFDRRRCRLFKRGAGFINIGRAGSLDHDALVDALRSGMISSAILDVYAPEPLPSDSPLWHVDNLILMPHVTSDDEDSYLPKTFDLVFENLQRLANDQPLLNLIDRHQEY
jgi:phosphoglycerate dehydrogenase-like enzyme